MFVGIHIRVRRDAGTMAFTHLPVGRSALLGVAAYVLGYLPAYLVAAANRAAIGRVTLRPATEGVDPAPLAEVFGSVPPTWTLGGWLLYNANRAAVSLPAAGAQNGVVGLTNVDLVAALGGPALLLYLVPPVLLVGAGYLAMEWGDVGSATPWAGGGSVAAGYLPPMLLGSVVFTAGVGRVAASPDGVTTVFAGLAYPVVFGAVGGTLAARRRSAGEPTPT